MKLISLRKVKNTDKKYFAKWWRDKELLRLTSGVLECISDEEVEEYFSMMEKTKTDHHFVIIVDKKPIGHISLIKRGNNWHETQIIIGEKKYWNKGYGTRAIRLLVKKANRLGAKRIYLEVRPDNMRAINAYEKCGFQRTGIKKYPKNKYLPETLKMTLKIIEKHKSREGRG